MKNKDKINKIIIYFALGFLGVIVLVLTVANILISVGGNRLKEIGDVNSLALEESRLNEDAISEEMHYSEGKDGWISRNGKVYEYNDDIRTFLLMGIDGGHHNEDTAFGDLANGGQADGLYLIVVNPAEEKISIVVVNRDTIVDVVMVGMGENDSDLVRKAQICVQHGFGGGKEYSCELTRDAVSKLLYGIPIHGYMALDYNVIPIINSSVGGVTVINPVESVELNEEWTEGATVELNDDNVIRYVMKRKPKDPNGKEKRLERQKVYIKELVKRAKEKTKKDISFPVKVYEETKKYMVTDLSIDKISYIASNYFLYAVDYDNIYTMDGVMKVENNHDAFYPDEKASIELVLKLFYREIVVDSCDMKGE